MTGESPMSVADQESIAGPSQRTEAQEQEVQRLLIHLEGWVNFPRVMLDVGVTQRSLIPLERLRYDCLLYTSPSPRDATLSRMPSSA